MQIANAKSIAELEKRSPVNGKQPESEQHADYADHQDLAVSYSFLLAGGLAGRSCLTMVFCRSAEGSLRSMI